jgi:predicted alpha/beta hydrolase family esterase
VETAGNDHLRILLLPGWLNSEADHWQTRWESLYDHERVEQDDWLWPKRGDWMARLDEVVLTSRTRSVLVAHSLGCHLVAAWAAHSRHTDRVRAAMLVAIPDTEREDMPPNLHGWRPISGYRLPFESLAVISSDDPYCALDRATEMAQRWGSQVIDIGPRGHVNGESGLGDWPEGITLLRSLLN